MKKLLSKRTSAFLIDVLLVATISVLLRNKFWLLIGIGIGYCLLRDALISGRSVGKFVVGINVMDRDGYPCTFARSILRNLIFLLPGISIIIEFLAMAFSRRGQRLGDRLAKTLVVDHRPSIHGAWFLLLAFFLLFLGMSERVFEFRTTKKEAKKLVASLEDYKNRDGAYPKDLDELGITVDGVFIYTTTSGGNEFLLTGIAPPLPMKISYSSERKGKNILTGRSESLEKEEFSIRSVLDLAYEHSGWWTGGQKKASPDGGGERYVIRLRNGQKIEVEEYWERGDKIMYRKFGGVIGVERNTVVMIENKIDGTRKRF